MFKTEKCYPLRKIIVGMFEKRILIKLQNGIY